MCIATTAPVYDPTCAMHFFFRVSFSANTPLPLVSDEERWLLSRLSLFVGASEMYWYLEGDNASSLLNPLSLSTCAESHARHAGGGQSVSHRPNGKGRGERRKGNTALMQCVKTPSVVCLFLRKRFRLVSVSSPVVPIWASAIGSAAEPSCLNKCTALCAGTAVQFQG